jgi:hypothetical protein
MTAPLILGTNSIKDTGVALFSYFIGADAKTSITNTTPTNTKKFTISFWIKIHEFPTSGGDRPIFGYFSDSNNQAYMYLRNDGTLGIFENESGSTKLDFRTSQVLRDPSAFYNIIMAVDTSQATASNRLKLYINGSQVTSFAAENYPAQDYASQWNENSLVFHVGGTATNDGNHIKGTFCEFAFVDGQQLDQTSFGEFDTDTPTVFKPISLSTLTFGNNGFLLEFKESGSSANSSGIGADTSGNNRHHSVTNIVATDQRTDTCTNNFATLNPLNVPTSNAPTFSEGNLISSTSDSAKFGGTSTIGVSSGKWYAEFKSAETGGEEKEMVGVTHSPAEDARNGNNVGRSAGSFAIRFLDGQQSNNNSASAYGSAFSVGDICQVALDVDNNQLYFGKNGQWGDGSGNFNQSTPTSAITITTIANSTEGAYFFAVGDLSSSSGRSLISCNFGSPPFSISSGNADANGHGNFEYSVPSGYFALCSKNLAEYG